MYCTKCEKEYPQDLTLCPECGGVLVEKAQDEDSENQIPVASESKEVASRIEAFFRYSGLEQVSVRYDQITDSYKLLVNESDYRTAVKLLNIYNIEEQKKELESERLLEQEKEEETAEELLYTHTNKVFVKSEEKYQELRSSATALISVGSILLIAEAIDLLNIIQLNLNPVTEILMQVLFVGMGLAFLIGGIISYRKAASMKGDIQEENELMAEVLDWFLHTYHPMDLDRDIDEALTEDETLEPTERAFRRLELIKSYINSEFDIPDESLVDDLSETLYQRLYEEE